MRKYIFLFIATLLISTSCGNSADNASAAGDKVQDGIKKIAEAREQATEKISRDNLDELLTEEMVRRVFGIADKVDVKQYFSDYILSYKWKGNTSGNNLIQTYSVGINFSASKPMSKEAVDVIWESQNKNLYKNKNLQNVTGIGYKASWSTLGGGQLRVATDSDIFYLSITSHEMDKTDLTGTMNNKAWETSYMIDKGKILAQEIISKL